MEESWGNRSNSHYDSKIPIRNILNLFDFSSHSVSYGDKSACFHDINAYDNENIRKVNENLLAWGYKNILAYKGKNGKFNVDFFNDEEIAEMKLETLEAIKFQKLKELSTIEAEISEIKKVLIKDDEKISL